jgi:hypothetical protein
MSTNLKEHVPFLDIELVQVYTRTALSVWGQLHLPTLRKHWEYWPMLFDGPRVMGLILMDTMGIHTMTGITSVNIKWKKRCFDLWLCVDVF